MCRKTKLHSSRSGWIVIHSLYNMKFQGQFCPHSYLFTTIYAHSPSSLTHISHPNPKSPHTKNLLLGKQNFTGEISQPDFLAHFFVPHPKPIQQPASIPRCFAPCCLYRRYPESTWVNVSSSWARNNPPRQTCGQFSSKKKNSGRCM